MKVIVAILAGLILVGVAAPVRADHARYSVVLTIDPASAKALMDLGQPFVPVDVRPASDFRAARLPGARSVPLDTLAARLADVPRDADVVLYADADPAALLAYHLLRQERFTRVYVLEGGLPAWQRLGYRLER
jgi:rhodanese-related sulfurtransferase